MRYKYFRFINLYLMKKQIKNQLLAIAIFVISASVAQNNNKTIPLSFKENKGQVSDQNYSPRPDVLYYGNANGLNFNLTKLGISYQLQQVKSWKEIEDKQSKLKSKTPDLISIYRVDVKWLNANTKAIIQKGLVNQDVDNYYLPHCPNGAIGVKSFKDILYKEIYNGIDLKWYEKNNQLEYDFIIKPLADYSQIKFEINGAEKLLITKNGELIIKTPFGEIIEKAPISFQNNKKLNSKWLLNNNVVSFKVENYNPNLPLIIDPVVRIWSTFYGGAGNDFGNYMTSNSAGDSFLCGSTNANTSAIATVGAFQTTFGGTTDGYLVKFNSAGVRQWGTFYGGSSSDDASTCALDNVTGDVYVGGTTYSSAGIVSAAAHQTVFGGSSDGYLAKFNPTTGARIWATYYGGGNSDGILGCNTDASGNVFVTGGTNSSGIGVIATSGVYQTTLNTNTPGGSDGFLAKFNSSGVRQWGTYCGTDSGLDQFRSCKVDPSGDIYIAGQINSPFTASLIVTPGAHQTVGGGGDDAVLLKFNSSGSLVWGTLYGGSGSDYGYSCATDAFGQVYLIGYTSSTNSISTSGSFQQNFAGGNDGFVAKFSSTGTRQWATYFGDNASDAAYGSCTDATGNIYICGTTTSTNPGVMATPGSHQYNYGGINDGFITKFSTTGSLQWSSYYGGTASDVLRMCTANSNTVFACGNSASTGTDVATATSHQPNNGGANDAIFIAFNDCAGSSLSITGNTNMCIGQTSTLAVLGAGLTSYTWNPGPNTNSISISPTATTSYSISVSTATTICKYNFVQTVSVSANPTVNISSTSNTICAGDSPTITATGATNYTWNTASTSSSISPTPNISATYTVVGSNGGICSTTKTISIAVNVLPTVSISATSNTTCISGATISLVASPPGGIYSGAAVTGSVFTPPSIAGTYSVSYSYTNSLTGCSNSANDFIMVDLCTGIENLNASESSIQIYPNPTSDILFIATNNTCNLQMVNVLGEKVLEAQLQAGTNTINFSKLATGIYYINLTQGEKTTVKKIIKN